MYTCDTCSSNFSSIKKYDKHIFNHRNLPDFKAVCKYGDCSKSFNDYKNYRKHIYRMHNFKKVIQSPNDLSCTRENCSFVSKNLFSFKKHANKHLSNGESLKCPFSNCAKDNKIFISKSSFNLHLFYWHKDLEESSDEKIAEEKNPVNSLDNLTDWHTISGTDSDQQEDSPDSSEVEDAKEDEEEDFISDGNSTQENIERNDLDSTRILAQNMLLLSTKHFATEAIVQQSVAGISSAYKKCEQNFMNNLDNSNFSDEHKKEISEMFTKHFAPFNEPLDLQKGVLRNTYSRNKYYSENFNFVEPVQIKLQKECDEVENENMDSFLKNENYYHYVPILDTLKRLLSNDQVRQYCQKSKVSKDNSVFCDLSDGLIVKNNSFLYNKSNVISLIMFQDAFEIVNPLGSSRKMFKLVGVYFVLANLPPFLRSKVQNIKLALLCREKYVEKFGWDQVLKELLNDIKTLESEGIKVTCQDGIEHYHGTLLVMLGDNLGSHQIGGFTDNFSKSTHFCRFCEITRKELKSGNYKIRNLRDRINYEINYRKAVENNKICFGVKRNSPLNNLQFFHVCNPGLPPCSAHDLYEGIIPFDLAMAIKYFISENWFSYDELNDRIKNFRFCNEEKQTIPPVTDGKKLTGNASEMRRLLLIFPIVIIDKVQDFEDPVWKMVMHMREVSALVCAPAISIQQISLLQQNITDYLDLRIKCFPFNPLRPKHHYVYHYPSLILHFGPLKHLWTLRFESQHSFFKNVIRHCKNFKNVTRSLSLKHELQQCLNMNEQTYASTVSAINACPYNHASIITDPETRLLVSNLGNAGKIHRVCTEATFKGVTYKRDMTVCVGKDELNKFILCTIDEILIDDTHQSIIFLGLRHEATYNEDLGVFQSIKHNELEESRDELFTFKYSQLLSPHPFLKTNIECDEVYVCKYAPLVKKI